MTRIKLGLAAAAAMLSLTAQTGHAIDFELKSESHLEACRNIQDMIDHYTNLQRGGGSQGMMRGWGRFQARYENEFKTQQCTFVGSSTTEGDQSA